MTNEFKNKVILITGGAGSIGSAIALDLLKYKPKAVRILDIHEYSLYKLERIAHGEGKKAMRYVIGDIRDSDRLKKAMQDVDIVYHAAAYKHVPLCEYNPLEAVKTNIMGTHNVVEAAIHNNVKKVVFISTDKAANPTGTLGASKLLGEKIITAGNYHRGGPLPIFSSVRFGNVTMSAGSVIPTFVHQIKHGGPVTVTSPVMTRFMMSLHDAVNLIFNATKMMKGGEVFVFKMKSVLIADLAKIIIKEYPHFNDKEKKAIAVKYTKPRPGEKTHEQLVVDEECERAIETEDILILLPSVNPPYEDLRIEHPLESKIKKINAQNYFSDKCLMSEEQLCQFIRRNKIVESFFL